MRHDVRVFPLLTCVLAIAAALLDPGRLPLWAMALGMCLHQVARLRSTPLLVTVVMQWVFVSNTWPADHVMALAAYCFFYITYEMETERSAKVVPAQTQTVELQTTISPMSPREL